MYFTVILANFRYKNSKNEEIWEIQEDQRRYMFIFWLLFRLVGISSISETGLFYVWIRSNILKRILHQIGQTSSFLIIDTVDPMKNNTTVHRGLSHTISTELTVVRIGVVRKIGVYRIDLGKRTVILCSVPF